MEWNLEILPKARKQLDQLDRQTKIRILRFLETRLRTQPDPWTLAETLEGEFVGKLRYRVGEYRIICEVVE